MVGSGVRRTPSISEGFGMMTKSQMEDAIKNCNRQLSAIEQILPTLATKQDLERFATKQDLEGFATKQDLERYATKQDLERYATKKDLQEGLAGVKSELLVRIEILDDKFDMLADGFASQEVKLQMLAVVADTVALHTVQLDAIGSAVRTLTTRLEQKGVI
jgi:hypothetical protein